MTEIREVLRAWLSGAGLRRVAEQAGVDRKTARRYVDAAVGAGLTRDGGLAQLTDELVGLVAEAVRPARPGGHGLAWEQLEACREQIESQVKAGLSVVKIGVLLERRGVVVPYRTLHRFCVERCGFGKTAATVRVADGEPGGECQIDFGYLGLLADPVTGQRRKVHALIFTACYSRHMFVHLTFSQTLTALIAGCEAAWEFFGGVFKVVVPRTDRPEPAGMSKARLVITAVAVEKRPVSEVARTYGVARSWIYALLARHRAEDEAAFEPRPRRRRPRHHLLEWLDSDFATPPVARGNASFAFLPSRSESGLRWCDHLIFAWSASPRADGGPPRRCASVEGPKQACRVVNVDELVPLVAKALQGELPPCRQESRLTSCAREREREILPIVPRLVPQGE